MRRLKGYFILPLLLIGILAAKAAEGKMLSTMVLNANIRSGPGTNYEVLWTVRKYCPLKILKKQGDWYYFKDFAHDRGWIHKSLVAYVPSLVVKADKANVRSGPGKKYPLVFRAMKGVSFKVIKADGKWVRVKHEDGETGWIFRSLLWGYTN